MSADKWQRKAVEFTKLGRLNVALHCWSRALEESPEDYDAWLKKGVTLEKLGKHEEAVECYTMAININPCCGLAWYNKGAVLGNYGNYREALGCFMEAKRQGYPKAEAAIAACRTELGDEVWVSNQRSKVEKRDNADSEINQPRKRSSQYSSRKKRRGFW